MKCPTCGGKEFKEGYISSIDDIVECIECEWEGKRDYADKVDEVDRLRKRTHEIQEYESKRYGELLKEYKECKIELEVWNDLIKRGEDYYWDEVKLAKRPLNLSNLNAAKFGILIREIELLTEKKNERNKN